ncbi:MAG: NifU family protein [Alphaproteobacteria bacterium]
MFIQTEATADPAVMTFLPGRAVTGSGTAEFSDPGSAKESSPLAGRLLDIDAVTAVSLGPDHIAVTKAADANWGDVKPAVLRAIMEHFMAGGPALLAGTGAVAADGDGGADDEVVAQIKELIETRIRPPVTQGGGEVAFKGFEAGVVVLDLEGPAIGLKQPIQNMLQHYVPEVVSVRSYDDHVRLQNPEMNTPEALAVRRLLDEEVNPAVAAHGGHIALIDIQDDTVYIRLEGGCQGCGMADVTLKQGVAVAVRRVAPSIANVLDVTDHAGGTNPYYQPGKGGASPL